MALSAPLLRRAPAVASGTPVVGDVLVPEVDALGELLGGERFAGRLAPDFDVERIPAVGLLGPGRDALAPAIGLLLLAASLGPFLVGQIELGPSAFDAVGRALDAMLPLGPGDHNGDVHGGNLSP